MKKILLYGVFLLVWASGSLLAQNSYALNLQDENHYFQIDDNANNDLDLGTVYTIEAWIYIDNVAHGNERIFRSQGWQMYVVSGTGSGGANATVRIDGTFMSGSINLTVPTEEWHHVCLMSDGTTWTNNYIDGIAIENGGETDITGTINLRIGSYSTETTDFIGSIDEVRISNIDRYSRWGFTVNKTDPPFSSDANTVLLYHFDDNTEFPPGNSSGMTFTHTNFGIDASDYGGFGDLTLPVELTSFTAKAGDSQVTLNWQTASEIDNQGFEILRSTQKDSGYELLDSYLHNDNIKGAGSTSESQNYEFVDHSVFNGMMYWYKLVDVDMNGHRTEHGSVYAMPHAEDIGIDPIRGDLPHNFSLQQNYPNPFNPNTTIRFDIPDLKDGLIDVTLTIYDLMGQRIKTLVKGSVTPGPFEAKWDAKNEAGIKVPSGVYIYHFNSEKFNATRKMVLMK